MCALQLSPRYNVIVSPGATYVKFCLWFKINQSLTSYISFHVVLSHIPLHGYLPIGICLTYARISIKMIMNKGTFKKANLLHFTITSLVLKVIASKWINLWCRLETLLFMTVDVKVEGLHYLKQLFIKIYWTFRKKFLNLATGVIPGVQVCGVMWSDVTSLVHVPWLQFCLSYNFSFR